MNLKERLNLGKKTCKNTKSEQASISTFFVEDTYTTKLIQKLITDKKNIIFLCPSTVDKMAIATHYKTLFSDADNVEILKNLPQNLSSIAAENVIIAEPSGSECIKLLEIILCDIKKISFCMNLKSFNFVLESFRTILALNNNNLTQNNIEHLIGISEPILIYVNMTDDGLLKISNIGEVVYKNNIATLNIIYGLENNTYENEPITIELKENIDNSITLSNEINKPETKINKYKLLKQKIKNKKL